MGSANDTKAELGQNLSLNFFVRELTNIYWIDRVIKLFRDSHEKLVSIVRPFRKKVWKFKILFSFCLNNLQREFEGTSTVFCPANDESASKMEDPEQAFVGCIFMPLDHATSALIGLLEYAIGGHDYKPFQLLIDGILMAIDR